MNPPNKTGYYWARSCQLFSWYDLIMEISGKKPFLKVTVIASLSGPIEGIINMDDIIFGPTLKVPKYKPWPSSSSGSQ